jgi:ribokinase
MIFNWNKSEDKVDFLAIGDTVVDAFIRLQEAHITTNEHGHEELCMPYADKVPFEFVEILPAVGNSANASVSAARLGLTSALITNIGGDENGKQCIDQLKKEKVASRYITIHNDNKTNYHYVLWYQMDRTILIKHEEYKYKFPAIDAPKWMYLSSLGDHTADYHQEIAKYLEANPLVKLAFQPGTFQMKLGIETLSTIYKRSEIFFCNLEEAQRILKTEETDVKALLTKMRELGPKLVVITDGPKGSYAYDGVKAVFLEAYPDQAPAYERTGAGDAFASTFTCAIALGKSTEDAMKWGSINAMSVVQAIGAQRGLLTQEQIKGLLAKAPEGWGAKEI